MFGLRAFFVINGARSDKAEEIKPLKATGWKDQDLADALVHGANMIDPSIMVDVFRMDQDCIVS